MLSFKKSAALLVAAAGIVAAQPALTTIQDILYLANGNRFNGTLTIAWNAFQAGDGSNVATSSMTVPIVNGVLNVQLVPTTTASAGAQYNVTFNSSGVNQFTEVWAVPPSTVPIQLSAVLVSQGTVVGPAPVTTAIQISDVEGLENELAIRPQEGISFQVGRAAIIDSSGMIDGAAGNLSDCVRVDGSSGPCGSGSSGLLPSFSTGETPSGTINGTNATFSLANTPSPATSLQLYLNGLLMSQSVDYTISGNTISFLTASIPQTGDLLRAAYQYANPSNPLGTLTAAQVICSSVGAATGNTSLTQLATCTMPTGLLGTGDRIEVQFQFAHSGTSTGFTGQINWGSTAVLARTATASETAFVGRIEFGVGSGTQTWDTQSWGNTLGFAVNAGSAAQNTGSSLTISFLGDMAATTTDSIILSNFTVIRYPAQTNP